MKNANTETGNTPHAHFPVYTVCTFIAAFVVATALCLWQGDVEPALALLCLCPMTLVAVLGHASPKSRQTRIEISRRRAVKAKIHWNDFDLVHAGE